MRETFPLAERLKAKRKMRISDRSIFWSRAWARLDPWMVRCVQLAQIGTFGVAAVVYFRTVIPLQQKAELDEQVAAQRIELRELRKV